MVRWTEDQREAIEDRGKNLLVSAAAGSGKTAVLVERIIGMVLKDGVDIDRLLIVTFTNAAAGEMRERVLQAFTSRLDSQDATKSEKENIRRQIGLLNKSSITTIHSFCINVLRSNFHFIDLDPNFRIADTTESSILIQESLGEVLEEEYGREEESFLRLVESFTDHRGDEKLEELIHNIHRFIQSQPYPMAWLSEQVEKFNVDKDKFLKSAWIRVVIDDIEEEFKEAVKLLQMAIERADGDEVIGEKYGPALRDDLESVEKWQSMVRLGDIDQLFESLSSHKHMKFKPVPKDSDQDLKLQVDSLRKEYKAIIEGLKTGFLKKNIDDYYGEVRAIYPMLNHLKKLVESFSSLYRAKKMEKSIVDFNDLEHYTLELLEFEDVRERLRSNYDYIFVDEYQDSNIVQETIVESICRDNNRFLVGDVKQSIYRFRLADPTIFIEKYFDYRREENGLSKRIDLSKNFRSRKEVIDGVNFIFKQIMSQKLGEIDYTEDAYLYTGSEYQDIYDNSIELNIIEKKLDVREDSEADKSDEFPEKSKELLELEDMKSAEVEAYFIADRIKSLIGKKTYDAKLKEYRDIGYRDVVILLRAMKNWGNVYEEIFIKEGIPIYIDDSTGYFDALEIKITLNLLSIIDNTRQDIPLLSVMRSMVGGFTLEELIAIRIQDKTGSYYKAIYKYMEEFNDELSQKLKGFMERIEEWKRYSRYYKLDEFIWKVLSDTNYYNYVGGMVNGEQRQANLTMLVDRANDFEKGSINGLFNFIRFSDKLRDISGDMGTAKTIGESENVVRLMSIHKSKGLEFPVVICGGLGKQFNMNDSKNDLVFHKNLGIATRYVDLERRKYNSSLPELAIKKRLKIESLSEELRILYVAFTRAKDKLILFGALNDLEKNALKWFRETTVYSLQKARSFMDWIGMALSNHPQARTQLEQALGLESTGKDFIQDDSKWTVNVYSKREIVEREQNKVQEKTEKKEVLEKYRSQNPEIKREIDRRFNWKYAFESEAQTPSKVSVTQLKNIGKTSVEYIKLPELQELPEFLREERGYSQAERGTINHRVFEMLDFTRVWTRECMENEIERYVSEGILKVEEAELIDRDGVISFFESELYRRVLGSPRVRKEQSFVYKKQEEQEFYIQGIIDCYFEEAGGVVLIDYKTDSIDDESKLRSRYLDQIQMYSEAIESITGKTIVEKYIYSTHLRRQIQV